MNHQYQTIKLSIEGALAILTLNRPDKLNSLNSEMFDELRDAFKQISPENGIRCLLITGEGKGFCAGQDLGDPKMVPPGETPDLAKAVEENYNPLVKAISYLPMPVICAVNGVAAGAGSSIALSCDIVFAARSSSFIQSFCKIGVVPDSGGTWLLPRLVGRARASGLAMMGNKLTAEKAAQWGLIWECVDDDDLMTVATKTAKQLSNEPTLGLSLIKRALRESANNSYDDQLALEQSFMGVAGRSEDFQEGVQAFMEKRKPEFKGR